MELSEPCVRFPDVSLRFEIVQESQSWLELERPKAQ
jgi:hypothetical protein